MNDWIGLAVIAFVVLCGLLGLVWLSRPYDISTEEFERRAREGPGLLGASLSSIQKALDPSMERSVEVQEELKQGRYDKKQETGDPPVPGEDDEALTNGESDA